jgi:hypothetical protein
MVVAEGYCGIDIGVTALPQQLMASPGVVLLWHSVLTAHACVLQAPCMQA